MTKKDYELIAKSIWRSGYIKDKNKVRQQAKEDIRHLIANDLIGSLNKKPNFDEERFLIDCGLEPIYPY